MALTRPALAALALLVLGMPPPAVAAPPRATPQVVVYKRSVSDAATATRRHERALGFKATQRYSHALEGFAARLTPSQVASLRDDPDVAHVVPDRPVHADSTSLVDGGVVPVGIRRVRSLRGTSIRDTSGVAVAVLDTGVDLDNPDLNVAAGTNCIGSGPPDDQHGHGTHVAGIIAARNNGSDAVGVAPGTKIYAVQVLGADGTGRMSSVVCGIDWVTAHAGALGIEVANMSLSGPGPIGACATDPEHQAVCNAVDAGVTIVAAAGNDGAPLTAAGTGHVPAAYPEVLAVTAIADTDGEPGGLGPVCIAGSDDQALAMSNYATNAADSAHMIAAPGGCVVSSAIGGGVTTKSGTSMATPHVAAAAALCLDETGAPGPCAGLTPSGVATALRAAAAAGATQANGFTGDPLHPLQQRYYGYLLRTGPAPTATTGDADVTGETTADLAGSLAAHGEASSWWFELTAAGETITTPEQSAAPGADPVAVQASATGLDPGTTYNWRLVVDVDGWIVRDAAKELTTPGTPPPPAPDTHIDSAPAALTNASAAAIGFGATGTPAAGFECSIDGGGWSACATPHSTGVLGDGSHTFSVRAVSAGGKKDPTPATVTWSIDATAPDTSITSGPFDPTGSRDAAFGLAATEPATFECRIDGGAWTPCETSVRWPGLAHGAHRFEARAKDAAGNVDPAAAAWAWTITAPSAAPVAPPPGAPPPTDPFVAAPPVAQLPKVAVATTRGRARFDRKLRRITVTLVCGEAARCAGTVELRIGARRIAVTRVSIGAGRQRRIAFRVARTTRLRGTLTLAARGKTLRITHSRLRF